MMTTIRDAYQKFETAHGSEHPIRTEDELRSLIHACGLRYEEIGERFWDAVFDTAWAWSPDVEAAAVVERYGGVGTSVCKKLGLTAEQFNAMYAAAPLGGWDGRAVADELRARYDLNSEELEVYPLGQALYITGIVTADEGTYIDDVE